MELLKVENIDKDEILKNISFSVEEGEFLAIMGPSGSGKSTLLYQIAGMDHVTAGKIKLFHEEITNWNEDLLAKLRLEKLGFVFQQMNVLSNLNILDNVMLPAIQYQKRAKLLSKKEVEEKALSLMEKLSVKHIANHKVTQVSGGELQRACICRSMMNDPRLLFADEPTGALHRQASVEVMDALTRLNREGTTIVMVTHDYKVASKCDRILYLQDGRIKDEFALGKMKVDTEKTREEMVNQWLVRQGF